ncbi:cytochrome P450 2C23-like [Ambystoma mexicanum]|uniref:cytochrome P450 2C23-like n=1 Tax=Ambystoma mexicanum TaxID=8296 RepID=UPI0037E83A05
MLSLLVVGALLALALLLLVAPWKKKKQLNLPPGPAPWPLVGNLLQLDKYEPHATLMQLREIYGDVFTVYLGMQPAVVLCGYDTLKEAFLGQADDFGGRAILPVFERLTKGQGVVFANDEHWMQHRKLSLALLRNFGMGKHSLEEHVLTEAGLLAEFFGNKTRTPFDPMTRITAAVANTTCTVLFGDRFDTEDERFLTQLGIAIETFAYWGTQEFQLYNAFPSVVKRLPGTHIKMFENAEILHAFLREQIENHAITRQPDCPRDFIDSFLNKIDEEAKYPNTHFTLESLDNTIFNLFIAGTVATSVSLHWAIKLMLKYPEIQEKVQKEIDDVLGPHRSPSMEDRLHLPYTDAVIHEIQRYANLLPTSLPHAALHEIKFKGYTIPKGTPVIQLLQSALQDKKYWDDPEKFNPNRFLDKDRKFKKNEANIPFSAGKRVCLGESMAKMEIFLIFVTLLKKFSFNVPTGESNRIELIGGGIRILKPYNIHIEPRDL